MSLNSADKLGRLLRADRDYLLNLDRRLASVTGRRQVLDQLVAEQEQLLSRILSHLNLPSSPSANVIFNSLLHKLEIDESHLNSVLNHPSCASPAGSQVFINAVSKVMPPPPGFFLKTEVACQLLEKHPPRRVLSYLGVSSVKEALAEMDVLELFPSLRFLEGNEWLNSVFFREYEHLTPADFEIRAVKLIPLSPRWQEAARPFVSKKYHNISHLKELGVIFILPLSSNSPGETLRTLSLLFHYLHEISFYSDLFQTASLTENFADQLTSLLRGDVLDEFPPSSPDKTAWLVIQRYLAKDDPYDWRLFYPNINLEALHWTRAARNLADLSRLSPELSDELSFWPEFEWIGEYFKDEAGASVLISFNFMDVAMSLVRKQDSIRYDYHFPATLWNKLFSSYFSLSELAKLGKENLLRGWLEI